MYQCVYKKLLSFRNNFCCTSDIRNNIGACLHNEIKNKSQNDVEYYFFLTRLYFISFYHALIRHNTYLKHISKQGNRSENNATPTSATADVHTNSQHTNKHSESPAANLETCINNQIQRYKDDFDKTCHGSQNHIEENSSANFDKKNVKGQNTQRRNQYENSTPNKQAFSTSNIVKYTPSNEQKSWNTCNTEGRGIDGHSEFTKLGPKSSYKRRFQKKLYKYLVMKTHPDKTTENTAQLFIETKTIYQDGYLAILFILAVAFGYNKKLSPIELELVQYSTAEMIEITESIYRSVPSDFM